MILPSFSLTLIKGAKYWQSRGLCRNWRLTLIKKATASIYRGEPVGERLPAPRRHQAEAGHTAEYPGAVPAAVVSQQAGAVEQAVPSLPGVLPGIRSAAIPTIRPTI